MDILLVTAVLRPKNLPYIAKNIVSTFKDETELHPVWVICIDKYNSNYSKLEIKKLEVYLLENNIDYEIFYQGEEGKENYGGALMNEPLKHLKETRYSNGMNPFVLVLDDDNILSPNLLKFMHDFCMTNEFTWWLNMVDECGTQRFCRKCDRLAFIFSEKGYNVIHRCSTFDPSQMLIRLDTLLCLGGFGDTRFYDFDMMNNFYNNVYDVDRRLHLQGDLTPVLPSTDLYMSCYHNGLVTPEMIDKTVKDINEHNFQYEDSYIRVHVGDNMYTVQMPAEDLIPLLEKYKKAVEL